MTANPSVPSSVFPYVGRMLVYGVLAVAVAFFLLPMYAMLVTSFKDAEEIRSTSLLALPGGLNWSAWFTAWSSACTGAGRGFKAMIAGAGGAAHLPGMIAAKTTVPVLGVPVASRHLQGVDSLHSIVQMPKGIPVATFAIGTAGAANAALFAVALLANESPELRQRLEAFRAEQTEVARNMTLPPTA